MMDLVHSQTCRRHRRRHHQSVLSFSTPSYKLIKETSELDPSTNVLPQTDDADYDAGETFDNVPSHDDYNGRRLRTRSVPHSRPDNEINRLRKL
ncbi:unnamed protein product [Protopolystoma xenopodis]|uniref:Uncharacterized protein n=1 Tax=Protopolystoma xenopodis TaxID=117903 RepID=A0A3S5FG94_9PLAT|nr:unnamed protein product [Protopolystoma xenopodis]